MWQVWQVLLVDGAGWLLLLVWLRWPGYNGWRSSAVGLAIEVVHWHLPCTSGVNVGSPKVWRELQLLLWWVLVRWVCHGAGRSTCTTSASNSGRTNAL